MSVALSHGENGISTKTNQEQQTNYFQKKIHSDRHLSTPLDQWMGLILSRDKLSRDAIFDIPSSCYPRSSIVRANPSSLYNIFVQSFLAEKSWNNVLQTRVR